MASNEIVAFGLATDRIADQLRRLDFGLRHIDKELASSRVERAAVFECFKALAEKEELTERERNKYHLLRQAVIRCDEAIKECLKAKEKGEKAHRGLIFECALPATRRLAEVAISAATSSPGADCHTSPPTKCLKKRGPPSHGPEMAAAYDVLCAEGRQFTTKKAAYRATLERLAIRETCRGWGYKTFLRAIP